MHPDLVQHRAAPVRQNPTKPRITLQLKTIHKAEDYATALESCATNAAPFHHSLFTEGGVTLTRPDSEQRSSAPVEMNNIAVRALLLASNAARAYKDAEAVNNWTVPKGFHMSSIPISSIIVEGIRIEEMG